MSSIPSNGCYFFIGHPQIIEPTNAAELDQALDQGWQSIDKDFLLNWTASKPLSSTDLDLLLADNFYNVSAQLFYNLKSMVQNSDSLDEYVYALIMHRVPVPPNALVYLITLGASVDILQQAMDVYGLNLTSAELKLAGRCQDPIGLMELCRIRGVQPDGEVAVNILFSIQSKYIKEPGFVHEFNHVMNQERGHTTTLNLALWLQAPSTIINCIYQRGALLDRFSVLLISRHHDRNIALALRVAAAEFPRSLEYLLSFYDPEQDVNDPIEESRLERFITPRDCWTLQHLNILLFYGCSPRLIFKILRTGVLPDLMSWRLVRCNPILKDVLMHLDR